jgi:hypothetical protein
MLGIGTAGRAVLGLLGRATGPGSRAGAEPDPVELLAKALETVAGAVALARYAAAQTTDRRLRRTFRQLERSGERQARRLREQLARAAFPTSRPAAGRRLAARVTAGIVVGLVAVVAAVLTVRLLSAPKDDPVRRAAQRLLEAAASAPPGLQKVLTRR